MKFVASLLSGLAAASAVSAAPLDARNNGGKKGAMDNGSSNMDVTILQYALTLEHLENTFYAQALDKFGEDTFNNAGFNRTLISRIGSDEQTHVDFLSGAPKSLGQTPTQACTYDFGYSDINSFLATASILEGVGVSAYLGAAASIASDTYLTAAASILSVESRHSSFVRGELGEVPFPQAFDIPLDFDQVYSLASQFIKSCPESNPKLPVKAFPALTAMEANDNLVKLTPADSSVIQNKGELYAIWINYPENAVGVYDPVKMTVEVPKGFYGQQYVVLSTSKEVSDDTTIAGPAVFEISG